MLLSGTALRAARSFFWQFKLPTRLQTASQSGPSMMRWAVRAAFNTAKHC